MRTLSLVLAAALTGCAQMTPQEYAANAVASWGGVCETLGFTRGTDGFARCVMDYQLQADQNEAAAFATSAQILQNTARNVR